MYWEYVMETIVYYTVRLAVFVACTVYVVDTAKRWTRRSK